MAVANNQTEQVYKYVEKINPRDRRKAWISRVILWIFVAIVIFPLLAIVTASLTEGTGFASTRLLPEKVSFANYSAVINDTDFLPGMRSDIILSKGDHTFIIDTKYYGKTLALHRDKKTLHSANMYQIYTYVKNYDKEHTGNVAGMLLYAKTSEGVQARLDVTLDNNRFWVRTLDLNQEFELIKAQLIEYKELFIPTNTH